MTTPTTRFIDGCKTAVPILLGIIPFGTVSGIAAVEVGLSPELAMGLAVFVFAGASQLATLQLIADQAAIWVMILTATIINLRFVMYSASLGEHFKNLSVGWRAFLAYNLTDQTYALSIIDYNKNPTLPYKGWFYLGIAIPIWFVWQASTMIGIFLGTQVPHSWGLDFAIPLIFLAISVPLIKDNANIAAAVVSGFVSVVAFNLPFNLSLMVAACCGIIVGLMVERHTA